jgi:cyclopropane-fatty-acyl-phospholipid synthase
VVHSQRALDALFGPAAGRTFDVRYWDGTVERCGAGTPAFALRINRPGALRRMLLPPNELAIVEAYLCGDVDVDGDLEAAAVLGDQINARAGSPRALARLLRHVCALPRHDAATQSHVAGVQRARSSHTVNRTGARHAPARDRAAIQYHYDVGNDFYSIWLDRRMVYSCAYFQSPEDALDDAQAAKLELICRKLRLHPGERFLDVGCGWGALIMHAAAKHGVRALGITLSAAQARLVRERIAAAGLQDRCRVEIRDYRELPPDAEFDKIASVGMVEHVGVPKLPVYFGALYRALAPAGLLLNHGIVSLTDAMPRTWKQRAGDRLWKRNAFIEQYVFPDGKLGPLQAVIGAAEGSGFETRDVESLREHYVLTLRHWVRRLSDHAQEAIALVGERTYRTWRLYMSASAQAFDSGQINIVQTLLAKPQAGRSNLPLTRADLLAAVARGIHVSGHGVA